MENNLKIFNLNAKNSKLIFFSDYYKNLNNLRNGLDIAQEEAEVCLARAKSDGDTSLANECLSKVS